MKETTEEIGKWDYDWGDNYLPLKAYVNGKAVTGDPAAIIMHAHDEIALVDGTAAEQQHVPSSYTFASGL